MTNSFFKKASLLAVSSPGIFLFLGLLLAAIYGQCLQFDFVSYDDDYHVYNNLNVREFSLSATLKILSGTTHVVGDTEAQTYANRIYIPITFLSFQLQHALTGLNPLWFHAGNLLLFLLIVFSAYKLFVFWLKNKIAAFACILLFAAHPLNTEPTAWISGRKDLLCAFFFIQGLFFYAHYTETSKKRTFLFSLVFCLLAALSKPTGAVFFIILLAHDLCLRQSQHLKTMLIEKIPFLMIGLCPLLISGPGYALEGNRLFSIERTLFSAGIPFFSLGHVLWPISLSAFYPYPTPLFWSWPQIILIMVGMSSLVGLWQLSKKEIRLCVFGILFFVLTFMPAFLRAVFYSDGGFTSDRYMLLPLLGLLVLFGIFVKKILADSTQWNSFQKRAALLLWIILISWLAFTAHHRASIWKNSETLALDIVKKYPDAANAQEELGRIYQQRGLRTAAARHFKAAYLADPKIKRLIQLYELLGLNQQLIPLYQRALQTTPADSQFNAGLGMVYFRIKQFVLAQEYLEKALKNDAGNDQLYNVLAGALYYQNEIPQALASWQQALAINPNNTDAANNLGAAYLALGNRDEARRLFEKVLVLNPGHKSARDNLERIKLRK